MYASETYGMPSYATPLVGVAADTARMGTDAIKAGWRALVDPANPLFWFGAVLLVTVGAAGVAGSVRLGRARVAVDVGQT